MEAILIFHLRVHLLSDIAKEAIAGGYKKPTPMAVIYCVIWDNQKIIKGTL